MLMYEPTALSLAVASDSALEQPGCDQSKPKQGCATAVLPASHPPSDRGRLDDVQLCHALVVHATVHCKVVWHSLKALRCRPRVGAVGCRLPLDSDAACLSPARDSAIQRRGAEKTKGRHSSSAVVRVVASPLSCVCTKAV